MITYWILPTLVIMLIYYLMMDSYLCNPDATQASFIQDRYVNSNPNHTFMFEVLPTQLSCSKGDILIYHLGSILTAQSHIAKVYPPAF